MPTTDAFFSAPGSGDIVLNPGGALFRRLAASGSQLVKAGDAQTRGAYSFFETTLPVGAPVVVPHLHADNEEAWYVITGSLRFRVDDAEFTADAGAYVLAPRGSMHSFENSGNEPAKILTIFSPPIDVLWRALTEMRHEAGDADLDWDMVKALYEQHGKVAPRRP